MNQNIAAPENRGQTTDKNALLGRTFIPDFCSLPNALILLLGVQTLALIVTLIKTEHALIDWPLLGLSSFLLHCIGLSAAAMLCGLRQKLSTKSVAQQAFISLVVVVGCTAMISWIAGAYVYTFDEHPAMFITSNTIIATLLSGLSLRYLYLDFIAKQQQQAMLSARIEALQSRIRPHFLFNSMNTIASLIASRPEKAENAVLDLSELFRSSLNTQHSFVPLREELELCKKYLNIEGLRLGDRLKVEWNIEAKAGAYLIPPLSLQPLVENAIYHGIQPIEEGGTIRFEGYEKKQHLYLLISNPIARSVKSAHGNQIALSNIADRLSALFEDQAVLKTSQLNDVFTTTLRIPVRTEK